MSPLTRSLVAGIVALACASAAHAQDGGARPNILFILVDDLGWADLPAYGNTFHETPHIDRLAREGLLFSDAYAAAPVCSPTRASIQSGQYPARLGLTDFIPGHWRPYERVTVPVNRTQHLPLGVTTVGEAMQALGYATGYFGKWHLGRYDTHGPQRQGYDEAIVYQGWGHYDLARKLAPPQDSLDGSAYLADVLTDYGVDFIRRHQEEPFFLTVSHFAVHIPLEADRSLVAKYAQKPRPERGPGNPVYAAMVEHVDQSVGRLLAALDTLELAENTLVVFYSDNGGLVERFDRMDGQVVSTNAPLRSEKGSLYEGGIRVPLFVRWPGVTAPASVTRALMTSVDLYPTFVDAAGGTLPDVPLDGVSLVPVLGGADLGGAELEEERALFFHYPHYHHGVPAGAVRQGTYKLLEPYDGGAPELYNLAVDPEERHNLAGVLPEVARALQEHLATWRTSVGAAMPTPNPNFDEERRAEWGRHPGR